MMFRRAVVLPVVLLMLVIIGLIGAMFAFHVHADVASMRAVEARLQTRLAAEAGVEYVKLMLRTSRLDRARWYNNPEELNRVLVWSDATAPQDWGLNRDWNDLGMAYRFSIVADDPTDDEDFARFGITDESAKLNLNEGTAEQLIVLVRLALADDDSVDPQAIVDAILDWRDADSDPRGEEGDTEGDYYRTLTKPYLVKNAPFDSVEELLLVKGVTEQLLYGEDRDRNGLMTPNENDNDLLYPPDNLDGALNRGMYPYLTVHSSDKNVGNDNRPRTYLYGAEVSVRDALAKVLDDHGDWVDFVIQTIKARPREGKPPSKKPPGKGGKPAGQPGGEPGAPAEGEGGNPAGEGGQNPATGDGGGKPNQPGTGGGQKPPTAPGAEPPSTTKPPGGKSPKPPGGLRPGSGEKSPGGKSPPGESKPPRNQKSSLATAKLQGEPGTGGPGGVKPPVKGGGKKPPGSQGASPSAGSDAPSDAGGGSPPPSGDSGAGEDDGSSDQGEGSESGSDQPEGDGAQEAGGDTTTTQPILSPAAFFVEQSVDGVMRQSPLPVEYLAVMLDRFTVEPPSKQKLVGLVNVNTAPRPVLMTLPGLTEQQIGAILEVRDGLSAEAAATPAWLVTSGAVDIQAFEKIAHRVTARGQQFMVESIGFADHSGMVTRLQVILDMVGPVAQTIYYRDLSQLGGRFPIREEDKRRSSRGR